MSLIPCDRCHERERLKLTSVTWAWHRADHVRVAWRQRLCVPCTASLLIPLYEGSRENYTKCPACGIDVTSDMDPIYATFYPAGLGKLNLEAPTCGPCAARIRAEAMLGAVQLEDQEPGYGANGTAPNTTLLETWRSLGLDPAALERP